MISLKTILPITTVKRELMRLLKQAEQSGESFIITKEGRAAGVLMSADEYEGLLETLDILSNQTTIQHLKEAEQQIKEGQTLTHKEVFDS